MKQIQQGYQVVEGGIVEDVTSRVVSLQEQGWQAIGGLEKSNGTYQQVMVLPTERKVKEYTIIDEEDPNKFIGEVNLLLQNGWELQGGASVSHLVGEQHGMDYNGHRFVQAVVKY